MADEQIEILIKAVDEVSATVKKIEGNLDSFNKDVTKSSQATTATFQKQISTLLVLGNVASTVDNIFSSYTNLQLRLENATERVTGAQDRLRNAQERLTAAQEENARSLFSLEKLNRSEKKVTEELTSMKKRLAIAIKNKLGPEYVNQKKLIEKIEEAEFELRDIQITRNEIQQKQLRDTTSSQREVESATRGVTIAENNLARAQNAVIGTYINMGTQALSAIASLSMLTTGFYGAAGGATALNLALSIGTLGTLIAVGAALLAMGIVMAKISKVENPPFIVALDEQIARLRELEKSADAVTSSFARMVAQQKEVERIQAKYGVKATSAGTNPSGPGLPAGGGSQIHFSGWNDFVQRPGQPPTHFSSSDTLFGVKNPDSLMGGGGMTIIIEGNVYGTDPDEMAEAMFKKLRRKISV